MKYELPNTSDQAKKNSFLEKEDAFLRSLVNLPLIVVLRPNESDLAPDHYSSEKLFFLLNQLKKVGVVNLEIAWSEHPGWRTLIEKIQLNFPSFLLGAASVSSEKALSQVQSLDLAYAMTPFWDLNLQKKALASNQILIPGVLSPTEIRQACNFGCRIIKLFPASALGVNYLSQLQVPFTSLPFVIAAGGLEVNSATCWLSKGYGAIVLGRGLMKNGVIDPELEGLITALSKQN